MMKKTDPTASSHNYIKLTSKLPRKHTSILTQLRTGHIPLAKHLHRIGKCDSPICPDCLWSSESVQHFMLHCPAHQEARQRLRNKTGDRNIDITEIFTKPDKLQALFKYVAETGRLRNTFNNIPELVGNQEDQLEGRWRRRRNTRTGGETDDPTRSQDEEASYTRNDTRRRRRQPHAQRHHKTKKTTTRVVRCEVLHKKSLKQRQRRFESHYVATPSRWWRTFFHRITEPRLYITYQYYTLLHMVSHNGE